MRIRPGVSAGLIAAAVALLSAQSAHATPVFDFSFVVTGGSAGSGNVTGQIFGLTDNATSATTDVVITGLPAGAPSYVPATPIDVFATLSYTGENSFTVSAGQITSGALVVHFGAGGNDSLQLEPGTGTAGFPGAVSFADPSNSMNSWDAVDANTAAVTYSLAPAPEPSSIAVGGVALLGLALVRRRCSRPGKNQSVPRTA